MARSLSHSRHRHSLFATLALLIFAVAPIALASQGASKAKKKGPKPAPSASASASAADEPTPSAAPPPADTTPEPAPAESTVPPEAGTASVAEDNVADSITNTLEDPNKTYLFVGLRYRGTIIPAAFEHLFVSDGSTPFSNSFGGELDIRKNNHSNVIWLQYTEFTFGNTLFFQKNTDDHPNNYSIVNSGLKGIYLGVDELWSTPIVNHLDFEGGFSVGLGVIFGNLTNDWAYLATQNTPGALKASNGNYYAPCNSANDSAGMTPSYNDSCNQANHSGATVAKTGNYVEKNWFNGGSVPVLFPQFGLQVGLRYKPIKQIQARATAGFNILVPGIMLGLSVDYGLESTPSHEDTHPAALPPAKEPPASEDEHKSSLEVGRRDTL